MDYQEVRYDVSEAIATVTLHRPDKLNAWTMRMEGEYRHALAAAEQDPEVRVIVVTGAGRGFCSGADMALLTGLTQGETLSEGPREEDLLRASPGARPDVREDFRMTYTWPPSIPKPILAAVNGPAVGLGLVHTLYCDVRFASDRARFGTAFARRGLIAEHGISWMLPRLVGPQNALDLLLSGRIIDAAEAFEMRLVSRVVPHAQLMPTVRAYARDLATVCSPRSIAIMKKQVYDALFQDLATANTIANDLMLKSFESEDFREGVESFVQRRAPRFTGR
ncbi:MAG: enoyl-CoA hydratase [Deltaproteobacteria bacterium RBG_13_65_10]|nr:MAG: enoyl-CoA hydratase [Deltaproteobacteria bacterium RBG_13_65_10]